MLQPNAGEEVVSRLCFYTVRGTTNARLYPGQEGADKAPYQYALQAKGLSIFVGSLQDSLRERSQKGGGRFKERSVVLCYSAWNIIEYLYSPLQGDYSEALTTQGLPNR